MKKLTTSTDPQTIQIIPRDYIDVATLVLRDDSTNTSVLKEVDIVTDNGYSSITTEFELVEGRFYDLSLTNDTNIWNKNLDQWQLDNYNWDDSLLNDVYYKDKIFCTDQRINQEFGEYYALNTGQFVTEDSYDNDYIII